jgi:DNA-directed RNA polymerase subunit K/omega
MRLPAGMNSFEFVIVSSLRAAQLLRGCIARVEGEHKHIVTAQLEVSAGTVGWSRTALPLADRPLADGPTVRGELVGALLPVIP